MQRNGRENQSTKGPATRKAKHTLGCSNKACKQESNPTHARLCLCEREWASGPANQRACNQEKQSMLWDSTPGPARKKATQQPPGYALLPQRSLIPPVKGSADQNPRSGQHMHALAAVAPPCPSPINVGAVVEDVLLVVLIHHRAPELLGRGGRAAEVNACHRPGCEPLREGDRRRDRLLLHHP